MTYFETHQTLVQAWEAARKANQEVHDPNYNLPTPKELLLEVTQARTFDKAIEAWEMVNYYHEALGFALEAVEIKAFQHLLDFENSDLQIRAAIPTSGDRPN